MADLTASDLGALAGWLNDPKQAKAKKAFSQTFKSPSEHYLAQLTDPKLGVQWSDNPAVLGTGLTQISLQDALDRQKKFALSHAQAITQYEKDIGRTSPDFRRNFEPAINQYLTLLDKKAEIDAPEEELEKTLLDTEKVKKKTEQKQAQRQLADKGANAIFRRSTLLTSPLGLTDDEGDLPKRKTLLGV